MKFSGPFLTGHTGIPCGSRPSRTTTVLTGSIVTEPNIILQLRRSEYRQAIKGASDARDRAREVLSLQSVALQARVGKIDDFSLKLAKRNADL